MGSLANDVNKAILGAKERRATGKVLGPTGVRSLLQMHKKSSTINSATTAFFGYHMRICFANISISTERVFSWTAQIGV
jgi:hypothetical protein